MARRALAFFAEDFDAQGAPENAPAEQTAAPVFTDVEMEAARAVAWQEGHAAGRNEAEQALEREQQRLLGVMAEELARTRAEHLAQSEAAAGELTRLLLGALGAMMPAFCARHGAGEIQAIVAEILPPLVNEAHVRVQAPPEQIAALRQSIARLDPDLVRAVRVVPAPQMGPSDIAIRWQQGEAVRDAARIWNNIAAILAPHGLMDDGSLAPVAEKEPADVE